MIFLLPFHEPISLLSDNIGMDGSNVLTLYGLIFKQMMLNKMRYLEREHDISDRIGHCFLCFFLMVQKVKTSRPSQGLYSLVH